MHLDMPQTSGVKQRGLDRMVDNRIDTTTLYRHGYITTREDDVRHKHVEWNFQSPHFPVLPEISCQIRLVSYSIPTFRVPLHSHEKAPTLELNAAATVQSNNRGRVYRRPDSCTWTREVGH